MAVAGVEPPFRSFCVSDDLSDAPATLGEELNPQLWSWLPPEELEKVLLVLPAQMPSETLPSCHEVEQIAGNEVALAGCWSHFLSGIALPRVACGQVLRPLVGYSSQCPSSLPWWILSHMRLPILESQGSNWASVLGTAVSILVEEATTLETITRSPHDSGSSRCASGAEKLATTSFYLADCFTRKQYQHTNLNCRKTPVDSPQSTALWKISMGKPEVYRFPGSPTDVVVTLTHLTEQLENPGGTNDEGGQDLKKTTEFHLWSTVLKEQSKYFEADILRWSEPTASNSAHAQPATPWRGSLECIHDVGPSSYAQCFHAMYEAHYGESAQILAQTVVRSVADALQLLRVASNLGFSVGVDAALFHIEGVPWTAGEEASVGECINLVQVPLSKGLDARLQNARQSLLSSRNVVREAMVECWKASLLEWKAALRKYPASRNAEDVLKMKVLKVCNAMFRVFRTAAHLGVADKLIRCLVDDKDLDSLWTTVYLAICFEAVLLVFLRVMQALSTGEVVCQEEVRLDMLCLCLLAFKTIFRSQSSFVQQQSESLRISANVSSFNAPDLDTYFKAYSLRKSDIKRDLVSSMGLVINTLQQRHIPVVRWLRYISEASSPCYAHVDIEDVFTTFMAAVATVHPILLTGSHG